MIEGLDASGTETEARLKQSLLANAKSLRDLDKARVEQMAPKGFIIFFYVGLTCVGLYFRRRAYQRLFERLQPAQQAVSPANPT